ncbi:MAG: lipopolysaccharide assembly protein LapB [Gammaproteobacteria bacterium]|jgi:lipopolysaccharide biosynthesis regulator YciM|nr:lipopolysaccharide assembly protein LapB [Gammaproteobacteria bacterium]
MPTESTFLLAGLFFLAAALGYFFARFSDDDTDEDPVPGAISADYIKGLNFLLNEEPDQALEVFMRMVQVDDETLETHFALGSLFRRRGEVDRAIRVHQNIIARPRLSDMHREQALVALAEDYLSAGLLDRAEQLFSELRASPTHRVLAARKLVRIYEVTRDWQQAIDAYIELEKLDPEAAKESRVAHYYCELAEQALRADNAAAARGFLKKADACQNTTVRASLLRADLHRLAGNHRRAIAGYREVLEREQRLIGEVVPKLAASARARNDQSGFSRILQQLRDADPSASKAIALAAVYDADIVNPTVLECLRDYVLADPVLTNLVDVSRLREESPQVQHAALEEIRAGLRRVVSQAHRYRCKNCGYVTSELLWQCPSCRAWETVSPAVQLSFPSFVS